MHKDFVLRLFTRDYQEKTTNDIEVVWSLVCAISIAITYAFYLNVGIDYFFYSPDSWSYYELSKSIDNDFYRFNTSRNFLEFKYSSSFPPGFPALLHLSELMFEQSYTSGIYVNILLAFASVFLAERISKKIYQTRLVGTLSIYLVITSAPYLDEVFASRSIPLNLALTLCVINLLFSNHSTWKIFLAGVITGLTMLVRFDSVVMAGLFALMLIVDNKIKQFITFSFGAIVTYLPWAIFSFEVFGRFFFSDNSWVVMAATQEYVTNFPARTDHTLFSSPLIWAQRVSGNTISTLIKALSLTKEYLGLILIIIAIKQVNKIEMKYYHNKKFILISIFSLFALAPYALTGYMDTRYFIFFLFCFLMIALNFVYNNTSKTFTGILLIAIATASISKSIQIPPKTESSAKKTAAFRNIKKIQTCHSKESSKTYIFKSPTFALMYGAITGLKTSLYPILKANYELKNLSQYFGNYLVIDDPEGFKCKS